jgi:hypothetical protein
VNESDASTQLMMAAEWPHGLRCAECSQEITDGERYSTMLEGFVGDLPLTVVVCVPCGLAPRTAA